MVGRARRRAVRRDRAAARVGGLLRAGRAGRVPVVGVHDRRARRRGRRRARSCCARRRRPTARSPRPCSTRRARRAPTTSRRPAARRPSRRWPTARSRSRGSTASSGPGNAYVTEAKRQVAGTVGIDGLAGPSELAIVADGDVDIDMAALDLVAQAEHDPEARTFFITPDPDLVERVAKALDEALAGRRPTRDRRRRARRTRRRCSCATSTRRSEVVNDLASEHLLLLLRRARTRSCRRSATPARSSSGAGRAVPFGDYGVASNHVLPTAGTARFSSGLRASDYVTVSSVVRARRAERRALRARHVGDRERRGARRPRHGRWTRGPGAPRSSSRERHAPNLAPACATSIRTSRRSSTSPPG